MGPKQSSASKNFVPAAESHNAPWWFPRISSDGPCVRIPEAFSKQKRQPIHAKMSWRRQQEFRRKQKLREQEERRRQRLTQEDEDLPLAESILRTPQSTVTKPSPQTQTSESSKILLSTPNSRGSSSLGRKSPPTSTKEWATPGKAKRLIWSSPSSATKKIDPKWLDTKGQKTTNTTSSRSSSQGSDNDWPDWGGNKATKPPSSATRTATLSTPTGENKVATEPLETPLNTFEPTTTKESVDDDFDSFGEDLLAEFRKCNREKEKQRDVDSEPTSTAKTAAKTIKNDSIIRENADSLSSRFDGTTPDAVEEFTSTPVDDIESDSQTQNDIPRELVEDSEDEIDDSSSDEGAKKREAFTRKRSVSAVPNNPIAWAKREREEATAAAAEVAQSAKSRTNHIANSTAGMDALWSDSDEEPPPSRKEPNSVSKKKTVKGSPRRAVVEKSTPIKNKHAINIGGGFDLEELLDSDMFLSGYDSGPNDLKKQLHPILDDPKFGPFPLEPIRLMRGENDESTSSQKTSPRFAQHDVCHEIPASLSRYLAPFQQEGVKFMYKCLTSSTGTVLGDDMGCGKTVQVLSLLCALFRKTGTGLDARQIMKRQGIARAHIEKRERERQETLRQGRLPQLAPSLSFKEIIKEMQLPENWWPVLIIVPPTLIENWKSEFKRFTHFSVAYYVGKSREKALQQVVHGLAEILVTTKALFQQEQAFNDLNCIPGLKWKLVIIDEFHTWKSVESIVATNLRNLKMTHRNLVLAMTGTLMSNNHKELWNLIDLVETNYLGNWDEFKEEVANPIKLGRTKTASDKLIKLSNAKAQAFREKLKKIFIERSKEQVLREFLPTKNEKLVLCELSPLQKQVYQHVLTLPDFDLVRKANSACDCGVNAAFFQRVYCLKTSAQRVAFYRENKLSVIPRKQCCYRVPINPLYVEGGNEPYIDPDAALWRMIKGHADGVECKYCPSCCGLAALAKLYKLGNHLALLQAVKNPGSDEVGSTEYISFMKNLEFSKVALLPDVVKQLPGQSHVRQNGIMDNHFALSGKLKVLDEILQKFSAKNTKVLLFSYSTQTLDLIQNYLKSAAHSFLRMDGKTPTHLRQQLADEFNRDKTKFVFLLSTKAMGTGLNLTSASKVIIFDVEWNPSNDEQAQDRAYRIGQEQDVEVMRLVAQGTIDELKYLRQLYKVQLKQETLVDDNLAAPKAARMFRGVEGDKYRKGELFGFENLFRFKDGCFLHDIWKQTGKQKRKSGHLEMHEASQLTEKLLGIGEEAIDMVLNDEKQNIEGLIDLAAKKQTQPRRKANTGSESLLGGANATEGKEANLNDTFDINARSLNHRDLFREDRGRAAIEAGDEGFEEEMGGATQNINDVFEGGVQMPDNPQDGSMDQEEEAVPDEGENSNSFGGNGLSLARGTDRGHRTVSGGTQLVIHDSAASDSEQDYEQKRCAPQISSHSTTHSNSSMKRERPQLMEPDWIIGSSDSDEKGDNTSPQNKEKALTKDQSSANQRSGDISIQRKSNKKRRVSKTSYPNVNLFGNASKSLKDKSTTFSTRDLFLPTYKRSKTKKKKRKSAP